MKEEIKKEINAKKKLIPLSIILADIKNNKDLTYVKSKVVNLNFYNTELYPISAHFKSIIRF